MDSTRLSVLIAAVGLLHSSRSGSAARRWLWRRLGRSPLRRSCGWCCRCCAASWWRNTMISRSVEWPDRTLSRASDARNRYNKGQHRPRVAGRQRPWPSFRHPTGATATRNPRRNRAGASRPAATPARSQPRADRPTTSASYPRLAPSSTCGLRILRDAHRPGLLGPSNLRSSLRPWTSGPLTVRRCAPRSDRWPVGDGLQVGCRCVA